MNRSTRRNLSIVTAGILMMAAVAALSNRSAQAQAPGRKVPVFEVDATWPKLPNNWVVGHVASVAVDRHDHVWMLHRPNTISEDRRKNAAPPVLEFDASGKFVHAWGGPGNGYDWPDSEHGIAVDYKDHVWIGGSAPVAPSLRDLDDDMLLKFDNKGKFLLQIGGRSVSKGNADTKAVHQSADVFVWPKTNEAFVADWCTLLVSALPLLTLRPPICSRNLPLLSNFKSMSSSRLRSDGATGALPPIQMLFL